MKTNLYFQFFINTPSSYQSLKFNISDSYIFSQNEKLFLKMGMRE